MKGTVQKEKGKERIEEAGKGGTGGGYGKTLQTRSLLARGVHVEKGKEMSLVLRQFVCGQRTDGVIFVFPLCWNTYGEFSVHWAK